MDDQNKKNDFDDFFQSGSREREAGPDHEPGQPQEQRTASAESGEQNAKPSYYYSYGPFKPSSIDSQESAEQTEPQAGGANHVEMTPPQLRPFAPTQQAKQAWQVRETRRSSFRSIFASFMAGVVLVGGLMFAADRGNWFTSEQALASSQAASQASSAVAKSGEDGKVSTAADVVRPNNIAQIFEKSSPAVVKIETFVKQQTRSNGDSLFDDPFFRQFFGDDSGNNGGNGGSSQDNNGQLTPEGLGTGFFFDSNGYILTNQHVIGDADEIRVTVQGHEKPLIAKKLGTNYDLDLAVIKVEGTDFPTLPIGSSDKIDVGDWVVAIGNPYGFDHTVTVGVLSAKERPIDISDEQGTRNYKHLLQTDASINPGNSGGPLLNLNGEVIGINTAVSSQAQGIGFAIPSSTILEQLEALKTNTKKPVPFIGASLADITDQIAQELGVSSKDGAIVANVLYKSPAYMADLRQYDIITGIDGTKYKTKEEMIAAIQKHAVNDKIKLNVIRNGKAMDLTVQIGDKNDFSQTQQ